MVKHPPCMPGPTKNIEFVCRMLIVRIWIELFIDFDNKFFSQFLTVTQKRLILTHFPSTNFQTFFLQTISLIFSILKVRVPKPYTPLFQPTFSIFAPLFRSQSGRTVSTCLKIGTSSTLNVFFK